LGYHIVFVASLWILWGFTFFIVHMSGKGWLCMMLCKMFSCHCKKCEISCLVRVDPYPFAPYLIVFVSLSQHCVISWWCSHIGRCCHYWPHSNWFSFIGYSFLWGCDNNCDLIKGWFYHDRFLVNIFFLLTVEVSIYDLSFMTCYIYIS
jgi:hypothetical protein